jgi:hypothetical protein
MVCARFAGMITCGGLLLPVLTAAEAASCSALTWADLERVMIGSLIVFAFVFVFAGIVAGLMGGLGTCDTGRECCDACRSKDWMTAS